MHETEPNNTKEGGAAKEIPVRTGDEVLRTTNGPRGHGLQALHPLRTFPDAKLRNQASWRIAKVILMCQFFLVAHFLLVVSLCIVSANPYYQWFYIPIPALHYVTTVLVFLQKNEWSTQDARTVIALNASDMCSAMTVPSRNYRPITTWASFRVFLFLYAFVIWWKPLEQYLDKFDPPSNSSSCTSDYSASSTNPYNPAGHFDADMPFSLQLQLKFCAMDQTYAYPTFLNDILGYSSSPLAPGGSAVCDSPLPPAPVTTNIPRLNGYPDANVCLNSADESTSYRTPVLGILPPLNQSYPPNPQIYLCKGNKAQEVCISADGGEAYPPFTTSCPVLHRIGAPYKICPICLNYWRRISNNPTGPAGYEHCPVYNEDESFYPFCFFCPGRGYGTFANEKYDDYTLTVNLVLSTVIMGLLLLEGAVIMVLTSIYVPDLRLDYNS